MRPPPFFLVKKINVSAFFDLFCLTSIFRNDKSALVQAKIGLEKNHDCHRLDLLSFDNVPHDILKKHPVRHQYRNEPKINSEYILDIVHVRT